MPWVAASGAEGLAKVTLTLCGAGEPLAASYTVRLCFAEHADLQPGDRVFGVALQGRRVIEQLDIVREAGRGTGLVKEFRGIAARDTLTVDLAPVAGRPTLCGIEAVLE